MNLTSAANGLKRRHGDPEARGLKQAQAKVGELAMRLELAEMLLEKRGRRASAQIHHRSGPLNDLRKPPSLGARRFCPLEGGGLNGRYVT